MAMQKYTGKVIKVSSKKLAQPDAYQNEYRYSIQLDDNNWYSLGAGKYADLKVEDDDKKYKTLGIGSEILIKYELNGDFRNSKRSLITILNLVEGRPYQPGQNQAQGQQGNRPAQAGGQSGGSSYTRDTTGIETGHAGNGALLFLGPNSKSGEYLATAKEIHALTVELKAWYRTTFPKVSEYDAGAASGNAILNALQLVKAQGKGLDAVLTYAKGWIGNVAQPLGDHIRFTKNAAPAASQAVVEPVVEAAPEPVPEPDGFDSEDPF